MGEIKLLDCTLRDGGYVNNWEFGSDSIHRIVDGLVDSGVEIVEIGFLRDLPYLNNKSVYSQPVDYKRFIERHSSSGVKFAAMIEGKEDVSKQFPIEKIAELKKSGLSFIRIMVWEWKLEEHMAYCKKIKELGIDISIQPTAVVDYTPERFAKLLQLTNEIHPYSFYIVDTWGTELPSKVSRLAKMADDALLPDIALGYHGHNNKMQGMACFEAILSLNMKRDIFCDVSIGGMGKGPGNLQTEVIADLLNEEKGKKYDVDKICNLHATEIAHIYKQNSWGYSLYHFIGSKNLVTQSFATYFKTMDYGEEVFYKFVKSLKGREKVLFSPEFVEKRLEELGLK